MSQTTTGQSSLYNEKESLTSQMIKSILRQICLGVWFSRKYLIFNYVIIPIGIILILMILYGFNYLLTNIAKIKFPGSVLGLLINLIWLCLLTILTDLKQSSNESKFKTKLRIGSNWILRNYLILIKPSMNFTLKWINVFFIPSFIILPLSDPITIIEVLKIAGVFVVGFIALIIIDVYFIELLKFILAKTGIFVEEKEVLSKDEKGSGSDKESNSSDIDEVGRGNVFTTMRDDITTIDLHSLKSLKSVQTAPAAILPVNENPFEESSKLSEPEPIYPKTHHVGESYPALQQSKSSPIPETKTISKQYEQFDLKEDNIPKITIFITSYIDWILYGTLFIVSLPFYYIKSIHTLLPYHMGITIIAYYIALLIPQKWPKTKKFAHPILTSTAIILFICFIGSLIYHHNPKGFLEDLKYYKTGKNYINLFNGKTMNNNSKSNKMPKDDFTSTPQWPGCGDFLSSLMDVSIVSLSLPCYTHRKDFIKNSPILIPTLILSVALSFFIYPLVGKGIGLSPEFSIGFIGRSVTLALGTPLMQMLGGSISLMSVCTILSGIIGVLLYEPIFNVLRVPKHDYLTRGVTFGVASTAIGTAHLLTIDPRAASISSLSFCIFGSIMIIMAAIGAIRDLINSWVY
ncbi:uncharacterized protein KGF55_005504 [Candida pseudojiufengensis]|uniref:uncharacterized protein n=1 Tax=Candida pseudojiufengensis TaxID=497109 RepID=UPI00222586E4|nr:uncharacterized protein KGF55_005504 [Candida pseudojiufengensis]KAI5959161.1 hypothetical protein KGF55_005504 [Candida pseudojiufengensis]